MKTAIKVINIIISVCAIISLFVCLVMGGVLDSLKVELENAISSSSGSMTSEQLAEAKYYLAMIDLLSSMYASMYFLLPASAIVGIVGVVVISKATTKKPLIVMGVLTIIFTNVVSGILMLTIPESKLAKKTEECDCCNCNDATAEEVTATADVFAEETPAEDAPATEENND